MSGYSKSHVAREPVAYPRSGFEVKYLSLVRTIGPFPLNIFTHKLVKIYSSFNFIIPP